MIATPQATVDYLREAADAFTGRRMEREDFYMGVAHLLRLRSTCKRGRVGGVAVAARRIIATGYNGAPPGAPHCFELGCDVDANHHEGGCRRAVHAEANLIAFAAKHGVGLEGCTIYNTHGPCPRCAQLVVSAGVREFIYEIPYRLPEGLDILDQGHVLIRQYGGEHGNSRRGSGASAFRD